MNFRDPRWPFAGILLAYLIIGTTLLGFNRSPAQITMTVGAAMFFEVVLHALIRGPKLFFPLSAVITGLGLAVLLNYSHSIWLPLFPVFMAIASKYLFTYQDRHFYNPSLFGVVISLLLSNGLISTAPSYQWGGTVAISVFVVTAALVVFVGKIKRTPLIISFLIFYALATAIRAWISRSVIPPETLFFGTVTSPAFYLFAFFMFTDPGTSPKSPRAQIWTSLAVVLVDFALHVGHVLETIYYAAFIVATGRFIWLHTQSAWSGFVPRLIGGLKRMAVLAVVYVLGHIAVVSVSQAAGSRSVEFRLRLVDSGLEGRPSRLTSEVDPRVAHVGKWLLSIGDAAAVADFDNDGLQDIFVSNSIKAPEDRGTLYRNMGGLKFQRVELAALEHIRRDPTRNGFVGGGMWFDYDNDGDEDLLVLVGYGESRLLKNNLTEKGRAEFVDVTDSVGSFGHTVSVTANALDFDRDGYLDLAIGNAFTTELLDYDPPVKLNAFKLPEPQYPGDRRMFNFMHRTWHNARNGGGVFFFKNQAGRFERLSNEALGIAADRWTLDIGTGDLDRDGWTDLYIANDFGPDQMLLNEHGLGFREIKGRLVGELGRDTYKGMNASISDFDNNGFPDVYVSNIHETLQTEGSLLWMNYGGARDRGKRAFRDEATARGALNERRFGWGAGVGDLNRDGRLDIVQSNGYIDDRYDYQYEGCPDYWYWNGLVALSPPDIHGYADTWADFRGRCFFPYEANRVYLNDDGRFVDVADEVGFNQKNAGRGVALADFDNDGDLDLVLTGMTQPPQVFENISLNQNAWLGLKLIGGGPNCNRSAIGTQVIVENQYREVQAKNGLSAQNDRRLFFGLGDQSKPAHVRINWCGLGEWEDLVLPTNRYHEIFRAKIK